jgi:hypothetical protein
MVYQAVVYQNQDDLITLDEISDNDGLVNFAAVGYVRMGVTLVDNLTGDVTILDSTTDAVTYELGKVTLKIGHDVPQLSELRSYSARLVGYRTASDSGETLIDKLKITVKL